MRTVGWHASHELYPPGELLRLARRAEAAGFRAGMCSDHFHPWTPRQGESGFAFSWLGAALQATSLPFGSVCCPFGRYNPVVVAQAAATLAEMFPGRYWLAVGTGQALNESVTGGAWPEKVERWARLREPVDVIRALWAGETVRTARASGSRRRSCTPGRGGPAPVRGGGYRGDGRVGRLVG